MSIQVGTVAMVPFSSIIVRDRARQEYGNLNELEASLKESGLIQPLAVKLLPTESTDATPTYQLLGGERRYLCLQKNEVPEVPVRIYPDDISEHEMKSIELAENFYRKDFEYWEYDALVRETHELQQSIHGAKAPGPGSTGWSTKDTGEMMGVTNATVSTSIKRADARDAFPELFAKCKTQKDASNVLKKMNETVIKEVIAQKIEKESANTPLNKLAACYVLGDCLEGIRKIPDSVYHLVEIDPPYAMDLHNAKKTSSGSAESSMYSIESYNEIDKSEYQEFMRELFQECYRVMANHSWLLCWFAPEPWFEILYSELINAGFNTTRMCGIWSKPTGQSKRPEIHLANSYEMFFYAWKGRPALNKPGRRNIFDIPPVPAQRKVHPTERPIELMQEIYDTFAFPGSRVLIPFAGSGNGIISANNIGMSPLAFDLTKSYRDSFLIKLNAMK